MREKTIEEQLQEARAALTDADIQRHNDGRYSAQTQKVLELQEQAEFEKYFKQSVHESKDNLSFDAIQREAKAKQQKAELEFYNSPGQRARREFLAEEQRRCDSRDKMFNDFAKRGGKSGGGDGWY